jgi:hypothetical protein
MMKRTLLAIIDLTESLAPLQCLTYIELSLHKRTVAEAPIGVCRSFRHLRHLTSLTLALYLPRDEGECAEAIGCLRSMPQLAHLSFRQTAFTLAQLELFTAYATEEHPSSHREWQSFDFNDTVVTAAMGDALTKFTSLTAVPLYRPAASVSFLMHLQHVTYLDLHIGAILNADAIERMASSFEPMQCTGGCASLVPHDSAARQVPPGRVQPTQPSREIHHGDMRHATLGQCCSIEQCFVCCASFPSPLASRSSTASSHFDSCTTYIAIDTFFTLSYTS